MKHNSDYNIDDLIKHIYQTYIDIKSKEFDEIQKDMLLDNIKLLYSVVKNTELSETVLKAPRSQEETIFSRQDIRHLQPDIVLRDDAEDEDEGLVEHKLGQVEAGMAPEHMESTEEFLPADDLSEEERVVPLEAEPENEPVMDAKTPVIRDDEEIVHELKTEEPTSPETEQISDPNPIVPDEEVKEAPSITERTMSSSQIIDYLKADSIPKKDIYDLLDINTRIGLVEIFFKGNSIELTECLSLLNRTTDKAECLKIVKMYANKYGVKETEDIYQTFASLVERKMLL